MPRNRSTNAAIATAARVLRKRRRWAEELRSAGWSVEEPEERSTEKE